MIYSFGWRSIFGILSMLGIIILIFSIIFVTNISETEDYPLDFASLALSVLACVGIVVGFSNISSDSMTSIFVWIPIIIGVISTIIFTKRQNRISTPLLQLSVFKNRYFTVGTMVTSIVQFILMGITVVLPIFIQNVAGYSATQSALIVLPAAILMAICNLLGGVIAEKVGIRSLAIIGNILLVLGIGAMVFFNTSTSILVMVVIQLLRCAGSGLVLMSVTTWSLSSVADKVEDATAINNTLRQIFGAMGSAILAVIMTLVAGGMIDASAQSTLAYNISCMFAAILSVISMVVSIIFIRESKAEV